MATDRYDSTGGHRSSMSDPYNDDEAVSQPIYMSRLQCTNMQNYQFFQEDDDSYEDLSDNEEGLDLSAPPSES